MKKHHQLFIFLSITSSAFCLSSDTKTESIEMSTLRFLAIHGTKIRQKIQIVLPNTESDKSGLFMSLAAYESNSPQRLAVPLKEIISQFHGLSPLGTPEPKKTGNSQGFLKTPTDHGVSPLGTESPRK